MTHITHDQPGPVLVVEDNAALRETLSMALGQYLKREVIAADGASRCIELLRDFTPSLVLLDVELADGDAFDVLSVLSRLPVTPPVVVISGTAGPDVAFRLAQRGVRRYVQKPVNLDELEHAVRRTLAEPPDLKPHLKAALGTMPLPDIEAQVRATMVEEALSRAGGNRRGAARILNVSRQVLQHMLRKLSVP